MAYVLKRWYGAHLQEGLEPWRERKHRGDETSSRTLKEIGSLY
jgi:hypothetical protein